MNIKDSGTNRKLSIRHFEQADCHDFKLSAWSVTYNIIAQKSCGNGKRYLGVLELESEKTNTEAAAFSTISEDRSFSNYRLEMIEEHLQNLRFKYTT